MKKKCTLPILMLFMILITALVAACSSSSPETTSPSPVASTTPAVTQAKTIVLRFATEKPSTHYYSKLIEGYLPKFKELTKGRVEVKFYPDSMLTTPDKAYTAVQTGSTDISDYSPAYLGQTIPIFAFQNLNPLFLDSMGLNDSWDNGIEDLVNQEAWTKGFDNVVITNLIAVPRAHYFTTKKQVKVPADLQGMKILYWSGGQTPIANADGASPVLIAHGDWSDALQKGIADGFLGVGSDLVDWKCAEAVKYMTVMPRFGPAYATIYSKSAIAAIPEDIRPIVLTLIDQLGYQQRLIGDQVDSRKINQASAKLTVYYPTEAEKKLWINAQQGLVSDYLQKGGQKAQAIVDLIKKYNPM